MPVLGTARVKYSFLQNLFSFRGDYYNDLALIARGWWNWQTR